MIPEQWRKRLKLENKTRKDGVPQCGSTSEKTATSAVDPHLYSSDLLSKNHHEHQCIRKHGFRRFAVSRWRKYFDRVTHNEHDDAIYNSNLSKQVHRRRFSYFSGNRRNEEHRSLFLEQFWFFHTHKTAIVAVDSQAFSTWDRILFSLSWYAPPTPPPPIYFYFYFIRSSFVLIFFFRLFFVVILTPPKACFIAQFEVGEEFIYWLEPQKRESRRRRWRRKLSVAL